MSFGLTRRFLPSGLLLLGLTVCTACSSESKKPTPPSPPGVTVATVLQEDVRINQEWVGTMTGNIDAAIRPKVDGFLLKRLYTEGSFVKKGQPLFQLDQRQTQASVEQSQGQFEASKAALEQAQIDVTRYTPLVAEQAVSQAELDKAQSMEKTATAQVAVAHAALDNSKLNRGWTMVASPLSGIAGIAKVAIGDLMTPNTVMAIVSAVDPIYIDFSITEQDYLRFVRGKSGRAAGRRLQLFLGD